MAKVAMSYKWCSEGIAYWFLTETEKYVIHIIVCLQNMHHSRSIVIRVCTKKLFFLLLDQNNCCGYSKTILLSTQNMCLN